MAVTAFWYGQTFTGQYSATAARRIDFVGDTIKVALTTTTYAPDQDAHVFFSDVTNEIVGTGYTAGGQALAGKTVTYDSATNQSRLSCTNPSWTASSFTVRKAVYYKDTGTASTSPLMLWQDFGGDQTVSGGTFTIQEAATGIGYVAAS